MATGSVILTAGSANLPDGSTNNLPPGLQLVKSSGTAPGAYFLQLAFDAGADEWCTFAVSGWPADYASTPVAKVHYKMASATSGDVVWDVRLCAVSDGDSTDLDAEVFGSANTATVTVPGTAGYPDVASVTLTNDDSLAAGDFVVVRLCRVGSSGSDTATGDAECPGLTITYTTT